MTFFISFANETGNLGVVLVDAEDRASALKKATDLGCNPGGEALICPIPGGCLVPPESDLPFDTLLSPEEMDRRGYVDINRLSPAQREAFARARDFYGAEEVQQ